MKVFVGARNRYRSDHTDDLTIHFVADSLEDGMNEFDRKFGDDDSYKRVTWRVQTDERFAKKLVNHSGTVVAYTVLEWTVIGPNGEPVI